MRVWIINQYALPQSEAGGTRHYVLARELIQRGHDAVIFASNFHYAERRPFRGSSETNHIMEVCDAVPFCWITTVAYERANVSRVLNMLSFAFRVFTAGLTIEKPDVILGSSPNLFAALAARQLAKRLRVPFVLEIRDIWPRSLMEIGGYRPWNPFLLMLSAIERILYRNAAHVISPLPFAGRHIERVSEKPIRFSWIPNGIDSTIVPDPRQKSRSHEFLILYAGSHGVANGLETLLNAAEILLNRDNPENIHFRLIGNGPEKERLRAHAQKHALYNVEFLPSSSKIAVYDQLQAADAFVLPLKKSQVFEFGISPNKLFDYMAMARPVLFGAGSSNNPVASADAGLSFSPENARELADAAEELARMSDEKRWSMGQRGRLFVAKNHDLNILSRQFEAILASVT